SLPSCLSSCLCSFRPSLFRLSWCPSRPLLLLSWSYLASRPAVSVDPARRLRRKPTGTPPGSDHSVAFSCFLLCNRCEMLRLPEGFPSVGNELQGWSYEAGELPALQIQPRLTPALGRGKQSYLR